MGDATLEALIPKTQELLQPLIAKPKLADKLLAKPPFRFLHDIFAALTASTGFAKGLYNDFELDSANIKEKHQKTAYLDKMIVCVGAALGKDVDVRSAKIVAGLEPENTNIFLQELARAASNSALDWGAAVQKALQKVPSLTPDGGTAVPATAGAPAPAAEAKASEGSSGSRPSSKEKGDAEKAAAEAKAKERAKREEAERKKREQEMEQLRRESEETRAKAEAKIDATRRSPPPDNNALDDAVQQQIKECNGDFERTKDMIEKIISKPKMAVKLLSKPPFRFLHDIVSEITRVTGFADGLYSGEELDSNAIKEKQPKIDYLNKIIACVSCHLNVEIDAKPAKIVAGLEPEDTNKFLQLLAVACRHGSSADAVQRVLSGDTALRASSASGAKKSAPSTAGAAAASVPSKAGEREATPEAKLSSRSTTPQESKRSPATTARDAKDGAFVTTTTSASAAPSFSGPMKPLAGDENEDDNTALRFPSGSEAKDGGQEDDGGGAFTSRAPGTSGTSRTSRPTTARRRPPKLKENVTEVGRLMVPDAKVKAVSGIMRDGDNANSDDDDTADDHASNNAGGLSSTASALHADDGTHGRLVRDLLKDEEAARKAKDDEDVGRDGPTLDGGETGIRLGRRKKSFKDKGKGGASSAAEMQELRVTIQKICQATLPMGKSIEFVHEDLDAMSKELEKWRREYDKKVEVYEEERKKTEEALQPLQVQLLDVDEQIKEQIHKINTLKATIAKNEEKTQKLLRMVVSA
ncbi:hypothetical protein ATCC90586_007946 [Pythium insidiosum]|nr:hypothetical protein ATCC90586_007946 [Pythium insidiosum]